MVNTKNKAVTGTDDNHALHSIKKKRRLSPYAVSAHHKPQFYTETAAP